MSDPDRQSTGPAIEVDITGLTDLAGQMRAENDKTLRQRAGEASTELAGSAPFGGNSASGAVYVAKAKYERNMAQAIETLNAYVRAADVLASAAERVANNYRGTDALAAARGDDVRQAVADELAQAQALALEMQARTRGGVQAL